VLARLLEEGWRSAASRQQLGARMGKAPSARE